EGALGALRQAEEERVEGEEAPDRDRPRDESETGIGDGVDEPSDRDRGDLSRAVGESPSGHTRGCLDAVEESPEERKLPDRDAGVLCAQQEESVSRVGEREEREDGDDFPEIRRKRLARSPRRLRGRPAPRGVRNREPENQDRREPGHGGREEDSPLVDERKLQKQGGQERSDEGARIVHGALETERPASLFRRNHVGEQRVAGGRADPLADSIREPDRE